MNPWYKDRALRRVARWIINENPEIWFTPASVTRRNPHAPQPPLTINEAEEVFQELARQEVIVDKYPKVEYTEGGVRQIREISAWELDRAKTAEISEWIEARSTWKNFVVPLWDYFPDKTDKVFVFLLFIAGAFITGFIAHSGEIAADHVFSNDEGTKAVSS